MPEVNLLTRCHSLDRNGSEFLTISNLRFKIVTPVPVTKTLSQDVVVGNNVATCY